jgi:hypothetical protein
MNTVEYLKKGLILLLVFAVSAIAAAICVAFLVGLGGNIEVVGFTQLAFDPLITIAYMVLHYFLTRYFRIAQKLPLFIFVLVMSFTTNFIQGSLFLVFFFALLRVFKIVDVEEV